MSGMTKTQLRTFIEGVWREMPEDEFPRGFVFVKTSWGGYWRSLRAVARAKALGEQMAEEALVKIRKALDRMKVKR